MKRETQSICILKTFAERKQEKGGAVTHSDNSLTSPVASHLFSVARTAGATSQCI